MSEWLWSPEAVHPAIVDRATWQEAQDIGAEHATSRDQPGPVVSGRLYPYRGRVRCRDCRRRMAGSPTGRFIYYRCTHNPANPRHAAAAPDHPRSVKAPEPRLDDLVATFFRTRIFGPGRAELLALQLPATDAEAAARRDAEAARLNAIIRKLDGQQNAQITALGETSANPGDSAAAAMRARIRERFAQLHAERTTAETRLAALAAAVPRAVDPAILGEVPYAGDIVPAMPPALKARLFAAFDITILWNKTDNQATVTAVITDTTLHALPGILDPDQDGYHDTTATPTGADYAAPAAVGHLAQPPIGCLLTRYLREPSGRYADRYRHDLPGLFWACLQ